MIDRRKFLAAAGAAAGAARGSTVRTTPLKADFWGTQYYDSKEQEQLLDVLESRKPFRWYGTGSEPPMKVSTFEKEFAARMQTKFALAVTSGTAALQCAMAALRVGPGDEVILPAWTWHSCYSAVVLAGALPVFAEIDDSFGIDPADIEGKITPQTKVILAAHLQGNPCDMDRIMAIAKKHGIRVLEDCAQSVGASYKGRPVGSIADIGIYSLQLNKTITAGEGGAVVTNDPELFEGAVRFHDIGALRPLHEKALGQHRLDQFAGTNFRMNEFSGGVLLAQLRKLDTIVRDIRTNARRVYDGIRDVPNLQLRRLYDPEGELGSGIYLGFRSKELCQRYADGMKAENVPVAPPAGSALLPVQAYIERKHTVHPAWPSFTSQRGRAIQYGPSCCPRTLDIHSRYAGVLMDPKFTRRDCEEIVAAIRKVYPAIAAA
ncbi:MAG: DegT/DnrJ/EryC1/StrS family aminotransferase [Bryobacteraceae bacterium]